MSTADEEGLLEQCPRCEYFLRGLPEQHHCPECGLPFDRRWRILAGRTVAVKHLGLVVFVFSFLAPSFVLVSFSVAEIRSSGGTWWNWAFLGTMPILVIVFWRAHFLKPRTFLAIGPDGVVIYHGKNTFERYSWSQVSRAKYRDVVGGITIFVGDKKIVLSATRFFRYNPFAPTPSAAAINAYPRPKPAENSQTEAGSR